MDFMLWILCYVFSYVCPYSLIPYFPVDNSESGVSKSGVSSHILVYCKRIVFQVFDDKR